MSVVKYNIFLGFVEMKVKITSFETNEAYHKFGGFFNKKIVFFMMDFKVYLYEKERLQRATRFCLELEQVMSICSRYPSFSI